MSNKKELAAAIQELRRCGEALINTAAALSKASETEKGKQPETEHKQPAAPGQLSLTDVRAVLAEKSRSGYTAEVRALLVKHGADRLSQIDPARYAALLKDAEGL